jgi:hypothetical protein
MAQQTKRGHVYIISNVGSLGENVYKVGLTRRLDPTERVRELGDASVPFPFDVHAMLRSEDAPALETALHRRFVEKQVNKVNKRKEFFQVSLKDLKEVVYELGIESTGGMDTHCDVHRVPMGDQEHMRNPFVANQFLFRNDLWVRQNYELPGSSSEQDSAVAPGPVSARGRAANLLIRRAPI